MSNRKALLVAAEQYGVGFAPLPAVQEDLRVMRSALEGAGYVVEVCPEDVVRDAGRCDKAIREFCSSGGPEDVRLIYFTGHGILVDGGDWIVPAGSDRDSVVSSPTQRISTDLSRSVAASDTGLVLFVIDACRDEQDVPVAKGGGGWGTMKLDRDEARFFRFFGCAATEVCQVLPEKPPASLFTRAFTDILAKGSPSLKDLLARTTERCDELLKQHPALRRQQPHLSYGESTRETQSILERPIFEPSADAVLKSVWPSFDPGKLHCLVVTSESEEQRKDGLKKRVRMALQSSGGERIWKAFVAASNGRKLVSGETRTLSTEFGKQSVAFATFPVTDTLASPAALDKAARALAEADLVVFDVTGFEPGIMLLIGIRAACSRAVTICSHGAGWNEGQPLEVPFNLQDLNIGSHTPAAAMAGDDPVIDRLVHRIEVAFHQLARQPRYLDLPAYDALRELGSDYEASSQIPLRERVLVLCSYARDMFRNWEAIQSKVKKALWERELPSRRIERIIDYGSPQLIWQSLYEQIRRTTACVVDWSDYSASVFLELGVRLAVSEWGAVHVVDVSFLPGGGKAPPLEQIGQMARLFSPIVYDIENGGDALEQAAEQLLDRKPDETAPFNRVHRALLPVLAQVQEAHPSLADTLRRRADALHHPQQGRDAAPQILFHGSRAIKQDSERAACELRVAAWLYLEHRLGREELERDAATRELQRSLGIAAAAALFDLGDPRSIDLARHILKTMPDVLDGAGKLDQARACRKKGDALRSANHEEEARAAYREGTEVLSGALQALGPFEAKLETMEPPLEGVLAEVLHDLVEIYGAMGGLRQRQDQVAEGFLSYARGAALEERFELPSTYNRLNAVKCALLSGRQTLSATEPRLRALATLIEKQMQDSSATSDSGWAWADLGDCLALLDDREGARRAYAMFISRAESKSPQRTLEVLQTIASKLRELRDPDVARLESAIEMLNARL